MSGGMRRGMVWYGAKSMIFAPIFLDLKNERKGVMIFLVNQRGRVVKLAYTIALGAIAARLGGSNPLPPIWKYGFKRWTSDNLYPDVYLIVF